MLLATDLDGTFLGGTVFHKKQLYSLIRQHSSTRLVFVTGRGLESVMPLLNDVSIPNPDYIICDVGATIVHGYTLEPMRELQDDIDNKWPGTSAILQAVAGMPGLIYQDVPQQRRCSFFAADDKAVASVTKAVAGLGCDVIYSAGKFLDVLPKGVNKGTSLSKLINFLEYPASKVLVAGDTLNDLAMYKCGYKGVAVGKSEERLLNATASITNVYHAEAPGAGGILEAMDHFPSLSAGFAG